MNTFETLLEIKTGKKNISLKAISLKKDESNYFVYFYDKEKHSLYINWIDIKTNVSMLEQIINKAYKQENSKKDLATFHDIIDQVSMNKKPKVFYFHKWEDKQFIYIDKINLKAVRNSKLQIKELKILNRK